KRLGKIGHWIDRAGQNVGRARAVQRDLMNVVKLRRELDLLGEMIALERRDKIINEASVSLEQRALGEFQHVHVEVDAPGFGVEQERVNAATGADAGLRLLVVCLVGQQ